MSYSLVWWDRTPDTWGHDINLKPPYTVLVISNGNIYHYDNDTWLDMGKLPPDPVEQKLLIEEYGMDAITGEQIDNLKAMLSNKKIKLLSAKIY